MTLPPTLDYQRPADQPSTGRGSAAFMTVYGFCAAISFFLVGSLIDHSWFGRPGDRGVGMFCILSVGGVSIITVLAYVVEIKKCRPTSQVAWAAGLGLTSVLPAYVIMWLLF